MKNKIFISLFYFIILFVFGAVFQLAYAQTSAGLQIKPAIIEDKINPGETYSFTLTVTNIADEVRTLFLVKQNIRGLTPEGLPIFTEEGIEETAYELSSWITLPQESITLSAEETRTIPFSIKVPKNASPGAHLGGIFFEARPKKLRAIGAGVGYKVGTIINLRISGEIIEEARLREFTAGKLIYNFPEVDFKARVENLGNVLIRPRGIVEVTDMFGKKIANVRVNESKSAVFPKSEKNFDIKWKHDGFAFGRYQAIIGLVYGEEGRKTISGTISFWVLPLKPILISLGSILGFISLLFIFIKIHINKKLREMGALSNAKVAKYADPNLYNYKYHKPTSRLTIITSALLLSVIIFLIILFFLFA